MKLSSISFLSLEPGIYEVRSTDGTILGQIRLRGALRPGEEDIDESGPNWYIVNSGLQRFQFLGEAVSVVLMMYNVT